MGIVSSVADLVHQLRAFHGYRTVWIDPSQGTIIHTEPDEELEVHGYCYVATVMRPEPDELLAAFSDAQRARSSANHLASWSPTRPRLSA